MTLRKRLMYQCDDALTEYGGENSLYGAVKR